MKTNATAEVPDAQCSKCGAPIDECDNCNESFNDDDEILCIHPNDGFNTHEHCCKRCAKKVKK
jgi:hypothetical protein